MVVPVPFIQHGFEVMLVVIKRAKCLFQTSEYGFKLKVRISKISPLSFLLEK